MGLWTLFWVTAALGRTMNEYRVGRPQHLTEEDMDDPCFLIRYRANYKPLKLSIESTGDIDYYTVSDLPNPSCSLCPPKSMYCVHSSDQFGQHELKLCNDWVYLSISAKRPKYSSPQLFANISTVYSEGWKCEGIERDSENFCLLMGPEECVQNCDLGCALLHCLQTKASSASEVFSMCIPSSTPESEKDRRCAAVRTVKTHATETCRQKDAGGMSVSWVVFLALAVPTLIFFAANIAYYRYSYAKRGRPPFDVPVWCPQCLYPRRESESLQRFATG